MKNVIFLFALMLAFNFPAIVAAAPQIKKPATCKEIIFAALNVKKDDGVDKKEALLLAQKYLMDQGFDKSQEIFKGKVEKLDKVSQVWLVNFPSKGNPGEFRQIWISVTDGTVVTSVLKK